MANVFCTKCGASVSPQQTVCTSCGAARTGAIAPSSDMNPEASFFSILLNLSFTEFLTLRFIKFIYVAGLVLGVLLHLGFFLRAAGGGGSAAFAALLGATVGLFLWAVFLRVGLEVMAAVFRIAENTSALVHANDR